MIDNNKEKKYTLTISLNVLYHLGINLYSNVPAVLTELVANCWDAGAKNVDIMIDNVKGIVTIKDDGNGMNYTDLNSRFLNVGYDRRKNEPTVLDSGRHVMGRKGIGKLSAFSIARTVEVHSIKDGDKNGFVMNLKDIEEKIKSVESNTNENENGSKVNKEGEYNPKPIDAKQIEITEGTKLILSDLKKGISTAEKFLKKRLARRFSIIGKEHNFSVRINGNPITITDRDYFRFLEFIWYFGNESEIYATESIKATHKIQLPNKIVIEQNGEKQEYKIKGWLGTVFGQDNIEDEENIVVIHSHGKLVQEDILKDIKEDKLYSYYLMGEIEADLLDEDSMEDIVTSDRQRVKEDDPRYIAVKKFITDALQNSIKTNWEKWRREKGAEEIVKLNPIVGEWLNNLKGDHKRLAKNLLGKINTFKIKDSSAKRELIKSTIIGFERLIRSNSLELLDKIDQQTNVETVKAIFSALGEIEAYEFYIITKTRLDVIRKFENLLPNAKERVLQEYLFKNLWLLNPSWDRATDDTKKMERTIGSIFKIKVDTLLPKEKSGRVDIYYKSDTGDHHIIELKKYDANVTHSNLIEQIEKYLNALQKTIKEKYPDQSSRRIRITCVLGQPPKPYSDDESLQRIRNSLAALNATFITYDELIRDASASYEGYLEKEREVSELIQIIDEIDKSA